MPSSRHSVAITCTAPYKPCTVPALRMISQLTGVIAVASSPR